MLMNTQVITLPKATREFGLRHPIFGVKNQGADATDKTMLCWQLGVVGNYANQASPDWQLRQTNAKHTFVVFWEFPS